MTQDQEKNKKQTVKDIRDDYYLFSGKVSDITRQMALAGIAIIWIFRINNGVEIKIASEFLFPLFVFIGALVADIGQYIYQTLSCYFFYRGKEKGGASLDTEVVFPVNRNTLSWIFFTIKVVLMIMGYFKLLGIVGEMIIK